jgi:hypothetical protein
MIIWVSASGEGVRMAAAMNIIRMAYRLFRDNIFEFTTPILAKKKITTGSSKDTQNASRSFRERERYSRIENMGLRKSDENSTKKLNAGGRAR